MAETNVNPVATPPATPTAANLPAHLEKMLEEEINGCLGYIKMYKKAFGPNASESVYFTRELKRGLAGMIADEYSHAYFIYHFMQHHDVVICDRLQKCYEQMEEELNFF